MTLVFPRPACAAALALAIAACGGKKPAPQPAVSVSVATAKRMAVPYEIAATGTVEPLQSVAVQPQVSGIIQRVLFREGQDVTAGQVLFELDPRPYRAALDQTVAALQRDSAQWVAAQADVRRYDVLSEKEYVTTQQRDQARAAAGSLAATVASDRAAVEAARLNLQYASIRSPIAGRTGTLLVREGNLAVANTVTLVTVNQLKPISVRFTIPATSLPLVRRYTRGAGLPVKAIVVGDSLSEVMGSLNFINNAVDTTTGTVVLKGVFPNTTGALWPGAFAKVSLRLFVDDSALVVPAAAIVPGQRDSTVFVVRKDSTAEARPINVTRQAGDIAVIAKGLAAGDVVVIDGQLRVRSGGKVSAKRTAPPNETGTMASDP